MQTRRDHVQAYHFAMGRLASALVSGDPGRGDSPTRRSAFGTVFGVGLVVLLCAGFGVYGLISPAGDTSWKTAGTVILEKETGNRYLYLDGELRPARNYASALLIAGKRADPDQVAAASLAGIAHGTPVGIPDAPDTVPEATALLSGPWRMCLRGNGRTLDFTPSPGAAFPADRQVLLSGPQGRRWLLWHGTKYPVPAESALIALGLDTQQPVPATGEWLSALPTGAALAAAGVPGAGRPFGKVAGKAATVGQVFRTSTGGEHYYVLRADGLAPVSATEYALLAARPGAAPREVGQADIAVARISADRSLTTALPDVFGVPALDTAAQAVCVERETSGGTRLVTAPVSTRRTVIPPGRGVLAVVGAGGGKLLYLITEQGVRYPVVGSDSLAALGYTGAKSLTLPASALALLPEGPVLSRAAAVEGLTG